MATEIYNDGASIRIVNDGNVILVSKLQIKTIDTIRNDVVRIDIGEGALKNIYLKYAEVSVPKGIPDVNKLRDELNTMLQSTVGGGATENKQDTEIKILSEILRTLIEIGTKLTGSGGVRQPIRIDESNPNVVYNGFAAAGAIVTDAVWAIQRVTREKDIIIYEWADGDELYDNIWDNRYALNYLPIDPPPER
jgi:hypothetical protein